MDYFDDMGNFPRLASVVFILVLLFWACASPTSSPKSVSTFTVTYNANGATSGSAPVDGNAYSSGASFTVLGNTGSLAISGAPTFFGYFGGWTGAGGNGIYLPGATATVGSNLTLYASWGGVVTLYAGLTTGASGSNNAAGTAASFYGPCNITTDGTNLYVADFYNSVIRKIVIASGLVSTLTGTAGSPGFLDGASGVALLKQPYGLVINGANLYVTDSGNNAIRQIVIASGAVTTLAGGIYPAGTAGFVDGAGGATAEFNQPNGITTDGTNLYVADLNNGRIRQVVIATGVVSTLAGNGTAAYLDNTTGTSAEFYGPCGIVYYLSNLYVSDFDDNTIRQISLTSPYAVTTLAGSGSSGMTNGTGTAASFNNPGALTVDGSGNLYLTDIGNHMIRKIVISSGVVTTVAGSGTIGSTNANGISASFHRPYGIAINGTSLYVADFDNNMIRLIN